MTFDEYDAAAGKFNHLPPHSTHILALGLCGEAGETAEHIKKAYRDHGGRYTPETRELLKKELGDVLWYLSALSLSYGFTLEDVAQTNLAKLTDRQARGVLQGSGDLR